MICPLLQPLKNRSKRVILTIVSLLTLINILLGLWTSEVSQKWRRGRIMSGENTDEFILQVLTDIPLLEVPLTIDQGEEFDLDIEEDSAKIIPGFGVGLDLLNKNLSHLFDPETIQRIEEAIKSEGFNWVLGQLISPNRSIASTRPWECQKMTYDPCLPPMSIIIILHNEFLQNLARTLHSYLRGAPKELIQEIIIVDDASTCPEMTSGKMERYLVTQFPPGLIRLIRLRSRAGIARARMIGAHFAVGEVIFFSDAHMEAQPGWAEPLLQRIKEDPTRVVAPKLTYIRPRDLVHYDPHDWIITGFRWDGWFQWIDTPKHLENSTAPIPNPTLMGGGFGMDRKYFWRMGSFDPGMRAWGGENLELPIRIWMCGGSVEVVPCSRVGHLYLAAHTYPWTVDPDGGGGRSLGYNMARVAKVWMDSYQEIVERSLGGSENDLEDDIDGRLALRNRLNCKDFDWYLQNVYPDKYKFEKELGLRSIGQYRSSLEPNYCMDAGTIETRDFLRSGFELLVDFCNSPDHVSDQQILSLSEEGVLRVGENGCLRRKSNSSTIELVDCSRVIPESLDRWEYNKRSKLLLNLRWRTCVYMVEGTLGSRLKLEECFEEGDTDDYEKGMWNFVPLISN